MNHGPTVMSPKLSSKTKVMLIIFFCYEGVMHNQYVLNGCETWPLTLGEETTQGA